MNIYWWGQVIPIWDEPHVAWGVDRGWIRPRVGGWKKALGLPVTSLLGKLAVYFDPVLICTCLHLCEVESVKGWSGDWNQEEGVVPGAAQLFYHGRGSWRWIFIGRKQSLCQIHLWCVIKDGNLVRHPAAAGFLRWGAMVTPFTPTDLEQKEISFFFNSSVFVLHSHLEHLGGRSEHFLPKSWTN